MINKSILPSIRRYLINVSRYALNVQGKAIFIFGWLDDLTKLHPVTLPITFGKDVVLLPRAKVSSDPISKHVQAQYSISQLSKSVPLFRGFPHKTKNFSETIVGISFNLEVY